MVILTGIAAAIIAASKKRTGYAIAMGVWTALALVMFAVTSQTTGQGYAIGPGIVFLVIAICMKKPDAEKKESSGSSQGAQVAGTTTNQDAGSSQVVQSGSAAGSDIIDENTPVIPAAPPIPLPPEKPTGFPVYIVDVPYGRTCASFNLSANGSPCTIGRTNESDVILNAGDKALSRRHFSLVCSNGNYFIADAGSTQGTFLNGAPLTGWAKINSRDRIRAGGMEYYILFGPDAYGSPNQYQEYSYT